MLAQILWKDVADPWKHASPHLCHRAKFGHCRSNRSNVIMEICLKILTVRPRLSGPLKGIGTDTDRSATYDFLLVFHGNYMGLSRTASEIKGNI